jgi:hypothetical protein
MMGQLSYIPGAPGWLVPLHARQPSLPTHRPGRLQCVRRRQPARVCAAGGVLMRATRPGMMLMWHLRVVVHLTMQAGRPPTVQVGQLSSPSTHWSCTLPTHSIMCVSALGVLGERGGGQTSTLPTCGGSSSKGAVSTWSSTRPSLSGAGSVAAAVTAPTEAPTALPTAPPTAVPTTAPAPPGGSSAGVLTEDRVTWRVGRACHVPPYPRPMALKSNLVHADIVRYAGGVPRQFHCGKRHTC